jgi:hypothetical protein
MTQPRIPSADIDAWSIAEGERDGLPTLLRFRPGLKQFLGDPRFSRRLQVTWTIEDNSHNGMPSETESDSMRTMEDALVHSLEAADAGVLAYVFTHGGFREWHYYMAESAELDVLINDSLGDLPRFPIEFEIEDDPEWSELAKLYSLVRE